MVSVIIPIPALFSTTETLSDPSPSQSKAIVAECPQAVLKCIQARKRSILNIICGVAVMVNVFVTFIYIPFCISGNRNVWTGGYQASRLVFYNGPARSATRRRAISVSSEPINSSISFHIDTSSRVFLSISKWVGLTAGATIPAPISRVKSIP